jgi:hypothetical protein
MRCLPEMLALGRSIQLNAPGTRTSIILDEPVDGEELARIRELFDHVTYIRPEHRKIGWLIKHHAIEYTPFENTLFLDSDCLVLRPLPDLISLLRKWPILYSCKRQPTEDQPGRLYACFSFAALMREFGVSWWPQVSGGGHLLYRRDEAAREIFRRACFWAEPAQICSRGWPYPEKPAPDEITLAMALVERGLTKDWPLIDFPLVAWTPAVGEVDVLEGTCGAGDTNFAIAHFGGATLSRNYIRECLRLKLLAPSKEHRPSPARRVSSKMLRPPLWLVAAWKRKRGMRNEERLFRLTGRPAKRG